MKKFIYYFQKDYFNKNEVIELDKNSAYKLTALVILLLGILFFLRDIKINLIGETSGWAVLMVLVGAGLLAGGGTMMSAPAKSRKAK